MTKIKSYKITYGEVISVKGRVMLVVQHVKTYHWLDVILFNADFANLMHQKDVINIHATVEKECLR